MPSLDANTRPGSLRVSDAEREQVAARIRDAAERGMLTLAEADERQAAAYAAKVRADLAGLTDDLPAPATERSGEPNLSLPLQPMVRRRLAALAVVLATALIVRWHWAPCRGSGRPDRCSGSRSAWCCITAGSATAGSPARPLTTRWRRHDWSPHRCFTCSSCGPPPRSRSINHGERPNEVAEQCSTDAVRSGRQCRLPHVATSLAIA